MGVFQDNQTAPNLHLKYLAIIAFAFHDIEEGDSEDEDDKDVEEGDDVDENGDHEDEDLSGEDKEEDDKGDEEGDDVDEDGVDEDDDLSGEELLTLLQGGDARCILAPRCNCSLLEVFHKLRLRQI